MKLLSTAPSPEIQFLKVSKEMSENPDNVWAKYVQMSSGPDADMIGWLVFDGYDINNPFPNPFNKHYVEYLSYPYGYSISFDLSINLKTNIPGNTVYAAVPPTYYIAAFGNSGYLGIHGPIIFYNTGIGLSPEYTIITITFSNIKISGPDNSPTSFPYHIVVADGETTNIQEYWSASTDGGPWTLLGILPPPAAPVGRLIYHGIGTKNYYATGSSSGPMPSMVLSSDSPSSVTISVGSDGGKQGAAIGVMIELPKEKENPESAKTFCW